MADQINQKDANQDQQIALLTHRIEDAEKTQEELRQRVRKLEKWVWGAGAVITAAITLIGFISAADAKQFNDEKTVGILVQKIRQYQFEQNMIQPNDAIDKALKELELWEQ